MASSSHLLQFTSIHPFCFCPDCFHPADHLQTKHNPWLILVKLGYHPWISQSQPNLWCSFTVEEGGKNAVEETNNRDPKGTRCHSDTIEVPLMESVFKEFDLVSLMYPAFCSLCSNLKWLMLILLEGNIEDHYLRRSDHIFQGLT